MTALQHCELWSSYQCDSGTRQAVILPSQITSLVTTERTTREDSGELVLEADVPAVDYLTDGVVLRLQFDDASFREYRVQVVDDGNNGSAVRCRLRTPLMELQASGVLYETTALVHTVDLEWKSLAPSTIVDQILTFCPSWWDAGTITPTIAVDLAPSAWNPLRALRGLVDAIRAQGVTCELDFRRNGTTGYYIDIVTEIGSSASALDVRPAKNLHNLTRSKDREKYAASVIPIGSGNPRATIGGAWFECTAKSGSTLTLQQPVTGGNVIAFDGQLDGMYLVDDAGVSQLISNSGTDQQVDVASATNFTSGRWYRPASDSSDTQVLRLPKAPATTWPCLTIESPSLTAYTNFADNPAMREWSGASSDPPDNWTKGGTYTITKTTTTGLWVYGGQSCKCAISGTNRTLTSPAVSFYVPAYASTVYFALWLYMESTADASLIYVDWCRDTTILATQDFATLAVPTGSWTTLAYTASLSGLTDAVRSFKVRVGSGASSGNVTMYVDSVRIALNGAPEFLEGSDPAKLWAFGNRYLTTYGTVPVRYDASFADLGLIDPTGFPYDSIEIGQTARVTEPELAVTTTARIHELTRDWRRPDRSRLTISTRPDDLTNYLATTRAQTAATATSTSGTAGSNLAGARIIA